MHQNLALTRFAILASLLGTSLANAQTRGVDPRSADAPSHPFALVENQGQWPSEALFRASGVLGASWFTRRGFMLDLHAHFPVTAEDLARQARERREQGASGIGAGLGAEGGVALRFSFVGAGQPAVRGEKRQSGLYNFMLGQDRSAWRRSVPAFTQIRYESMYPGVDVVARPGRGLFAYDLHIDAGATADIIVVECEGGREFRRNEDGSLVLVTELGELHQSAPIAWQPGANGSRTAVPCRFISLGENRFGFRVTGRDPKRPLVIDPDLTWLTYFGGSGTDSIYGITNGPLTTGRITVAGASNSNNLPTTPGAYQQTKSRGPDAFVSQFDRSLTGTAQLVWSTYLGGNARDIPFAIAEDRIGELHLCGLTLSPNFPVTAGALQGLFGGSTTDGFVAKLSANGSQLTYGSFLGGNGNDWVAGIAVDAGLRTTVLGVTRSVWAGGNTGIPRTANAFQRDSGGNLDMFVTRIDTNLIGPPQLIYSTYLGGTSSEGFAYSSTAWVLDLRQLSMAQDSNGRVLISGRSFSINYPTRNAYQTTNAGSCDVVVTLLDPSAATPTAQLVYSTYLGSSNCEDGGAVDFAPNGMFCVAGFTYSQSPSYPTTPNSFDPNHNGSPNSCNNNPANGPCNDTFVSWLDPSKRGAQQLAYSTFLGGSVWDNCNALYVDKHGVANMVGFGSDGFPTTADGLSTTKTDNQVGWMARLYPGGQGTADLIYGTYIGSQTGAMNTYCYAVHPGENDSTFVAGQTSSTTLPSTPGTYSPSNPGGSWSAFLMHLWGRNRGVDLVGAATPATCASGLRLGAEGAAIRGNTDLKLGVWGAQPNAAGFLGVGIAPATINLCGAILDATPLVLVPVRANAVGMVQIPAPIAAGAPLNLSVYAQSVWANSGCCLTASNALRVTVFQ